MQFSTALRNAELTAISTQVGVGGTFKAYTGTSPGVGVAVTGTLLSTLTAVTFGSPSGGVMTYTATADSSNAGSGTPGYVRLATSGGTGVVDYTAGVGTSATMGTVTLSGGGVATAPVSSGGTGYPSGVAFPVTFSGNGSGASGYCVASGGVLQNATITEPGSGYSGTVTATVPAPYEFTFASTIPSGGTDTLTSGSITAPNA